MKINSYHYYVADFETTVYKGQERTDVWSAAISELFDESDQVTVLGSIDSLFEYLCGKRQNIVCYFHNLKFDGSFWLDYLIKEKKYKQALYSIDGTEDYQSQRFLPKSKMKNKTFSYSISSMGQWYKIDIKINNKIIELRDSLKLLPFSLKRIGNSFQTKHRKLDMEYEGLRYPNCKILEEELRYIKNDVLVLKEAMEIMFREGHKKLTIGSCCLSEYKYLIGRKKYNEYFPDIYKMEIDEKIYGSPNAGEYVRKSYRGGWCYLVKGKENKLIRNGCAADVNSLYPSMMSAESLNNFPIGYPKFWRGNYLPNEAQRKDHYYFIRLRTKFYLKPGYLPTIQIKNSTLYKGTEMLETSDIKHNGKYYECYKDFNGEIKQAFVTLTLTQTDYKLITEHYDLVDCEILDGCYFVSAVGIFDKYIEKYKTIKLSSKGARKELAKLFLNNLYGKMASSPDSNFKIAYVKDDNSIGFYTIVAKDKVPGYIPVGSAITSYARNFTIRAAQKNYHGVNSPGFIYADTDSIHCDIPQEELKGIRLHNKNFCCWKLESEWDFAKFIRQKTYVEHIVKQDGESIEPYYNIKCAGMPEHCKNLFLLSIGEHIDNEEKILAKLSEREKDFISRKRTLNDFAVGLVIPGKLLPKRIPGGTLLVPTTYEMR